MKRLHFFLLLVFLYLSLQPARTNVPVIPADSPKQTTNSKQTRVNKQVLMNTNNINKYLSEIISLSYISHD